MNYTDWMLKVFSTLDSVNSAQTFSYITQAKAETKVLRVVLKSVLMATAITATLLLLAFFDVPAFESVLAWLAYSIAIVIGVFAGAKLEQWLVRRKLTEILRKSGQDGRT